MQKWLGFGRLLGICALVVAVVCAMAVVPVRATLAQDETGATGSDTSAEAKDANSDAGDSTDSNATGAGGTGNNTNAATGSDVGSSSERGSITLTFTDADGSFELVDGKLAIYCVATEGYDENGQKVFDVSGGQFASSQTVSAIPGITQEDLNQQNRTIAEALEAEAKAKSLQPLMTVPIQSGKAVFSPLERGLYLIFQSELSEGDEKTNTFLMTVPGVDGRLDVVSKPKHGIYRPENPPENPPDNPSSSSSSSDKPTQSTVSQQGSSSSGSTLQGLPRDADDTPLVAPLAIAALALLCFVPAFVKRG